MNYGTGSIYDVTAYDQQRSPSKAVPQNVFGGIALALIGLSCVWTIYSHVAANDIASVVVAEPQATPQPAVAAPVVRNRYVALMDPTYSLGAPPVTFFKRVAPQVAEAAPPPQQAEVVPQQAAPLPLPPVRQLAQNIPVPTPRPAELRLLQNPNPAVPSRRDVADAQTALLPPPEEKQTIFQKLFGKQQSYGPSLAFAAPDGGVSNDGTSLTPGRFDRQTAVYDISAHTVYLPNGAKLEAHSGLGSMLDDPHHADKRMRGVTPPHTYDLTMRESLFHGVQALRLNPVGGEGAIYGRSGLLAHTYMLGPNGDSNGCVSFRDYDRFLRAYKNGDVKRLVVVAKL